MLVFTNFYTMTRILMAKVVKWVWPNFMFLWIGFLNSDHLWSNEFKKKTLNHRKHPWKLSVCLLWSSSAPAIFRSLLGLLSLEFKYYYSSFCWPKNCLVKKRGLLLHNIYPMMRIYPPKDLIRTNLKKRGSIFCLCWLVDKVWPLEKNVWAFKMNCA